MKFTGRQIGILLTTLLTAVLHVAAGFDRVLFTSGPYPLFILNGIGYLGLLGAYFLPIPFLQQRHAWVRWVLFGYAVLTIVLWLYIFVYQFVILGGTPFFSRDSWYGIPAKISELILLYFLWADRRQA